VTLPLLSFIEVDFAPPGAVAALSGLSFDVGRGEFFALLGADPAARTAVALLAAGLVRPERGRITLAAPAEEGRLPVGLVFPSPGQGLFAATVAEEIRIGLEWQGLDEAAAAARTEEVLRRFGLWEERDRPPATLSGGEKQRLAIAAVVALEPLCLILDEPTAMLDPAAASLVRAAARAAVEEGRGVLWLTGEPDEALHEDRIGVLADGHLVWTGSPQALFGGEVDEVDLFGGEVDEVDLEAWGFPQPPLRRLSAALIRRGLPLEGRAATPARLVEEICSAWRR